MQSCTHAIGMMRIIAERTLEVDEELCVCFVDWQKAFDRVKWTKLMQILRRTGIDWRERRLISKLYMDQRVKVRLDRGETRSVQIGRGVIQGYCLSQRMPYQGSSGWAWGLQHRRTNYSNCGICR